MVCKVFEGFVNDALCIHLSENNLLSNEQFGFCRGRSCVTQLVSTIKDWMESLDGRTPVDAVYLDFRKAFDLVSHKHLLYKLSKYGITQQTLKWIEAFLDERTQKV